MKFRDLILTAYFSTVALNADAQDYKPDSVQTAATAAYNNHMRAHFGMKPQIIGITTHSADGKTAFIPVQSTALRPDGAMLRITDELSFDTRGRKTEMNINTRTYDVFENGQKTLSVRLSPRKERKYHDYLQTTTLYRDGQSYTLQSFAIGDITDADNTLTQQLLRANLQHIRAFVISEYNDENPKNPIAPDARPAAQNGMNPR